MNTAISEKDVEGVREKLQRNPGIILESLMESSGLPMADIIECLPADMWKRVDGERFVEFMQELSTLGDVTIIMHTPDVIMEFSGPVPSGAVSHGFYNLSGRTGVHGHLRANRCGSIYFVERPFMNRMTASIQFMNKEGDTMFKVFLGRDENGEIQEKQLSAIRTLAEKA